MSNCSKQLTEQPTDQIMSAMRLQIRSRFSSQLAAMKLFCKLDITFVSIVHTHL